MWRSSKYRERETGDKHGAVYGKHSKAHMHRLEKGEGKEDWRVGERKIYTFVPGTDRAMMVGSGFLTAFFFWNPVRVSKKMQPRSLGRITWTMNWTEQRHKANSSCYHEDPSLLPWTMKYYAFLYLCFWSRPSSKGCCATEQLVIRRRSKKKKKKKALESKRSHSLGVALSFLSWSLYRSY